MAQVRSFLGGLLPLMLLANTAAADGLTVPDDVASIQAALDAAVDTVWVHPGDYDEDLVFRFGGMLTGTDAASLPSVRGLRIAPSSGDFAIQGIAFSERAFIDNSDSPCTISFDRCRLFGGLRDLSDYISTSQVFFRGCTIKDGVQVNVDGSVVADSCTVEGGLRVWTNIGHVRVTNSSFTGSPESVAVGADNTATSVVMGCTMRGVLQPIILESEESIEVRDNLIEDCGTGIIAGGAPYDVTITGNVVRRTGATFYDAAIRSYADRVVVRDNLVAGGVGVGLHFGAGAGIVERNVAYGFGEAGIWAEGAGLEVRHNTSALNDGPGFIATVYSFTHNVGYGNSGHGLTGLPMFQVACNDWFANQLGPVDGMPLSAADYELDPAFCDTTARDFRLSTSSPLLDHATCGTIGALGVGCGPTAAIEPPRARVFALGHIAPNPGAGPIRIGFSLAREAPVTLEVFDLQGRRVASLASGVLAAGAHEVAWTGDLAPAGVYLVRYGHPGGHEVRRIVRLK